MAVPTISRLRIVGWIPVLLVFALLTGLVCKLPAMTIGMAAMDGGCAMGVASDEVPDAPPDGSGEASQCTLQCSLLPATPRMHLQARPDDCPRAAPIAMYSRPFPPLLQPPKA